MQVMKNLKLVIITNHALFQQGRIKRYKVNFTYYNTNVQFIFLE